MVKGPRRRRRGDRMEEPAMTACVRAVLLLSLTHGVLSAAALEWPNNSLQRARPPASLKCTRDHLTAFQGRVLDYRRAKQDMSLRVQTDENTTENFSLKWAASEKPETWFLLRGEAFKSDGWKLIESEPGKLLDGTRIIVWVCDDGSKPVFDWRPKEAGLLFRSEGVGKDARLRPWP
jgi:hypothetical protein